MKTRLRLTLGNGGSNAAVVCLRARVLRGNTPSCGLGGGSYPM